MMTTAAGSNVRIRASDAALVKRVCKLIETALLDDGAGAPSLAALGAAARMSPFHLQRTFRKTLGITPKQYADAFRLDVLKRRLRAGSDVTTAMHEAGYGSPSRLYEKAPARLGMSPATYARGGAGAEIGFAIASCALGRVLVGATEKGVCRVALGESDAGLRATLGSEYPAAIIREDAKRLGVWVSAIVRHLDGKQASLDLPLDVCATAFQWKVWEALRAIPYGETRSYAEVAASIGVPRGARAVARACATNPVALIVPCHRVVRTDGTIGQYSLGGPENKRTILAAEGLDPAAMEASAARGERLVGCASTHIVCWPTCRTGRHMLARNRRPFRSLADASAAGYRPCKICRPVDGSLAAA